MQRCIYIATVTSWMFALFPACFASSGCKFPDKLTPAEDLDAYKKLKPLIGRSYTVTDPEQKYQYDVAICKNILEDPESDIGAIQTSLVEKSKAPVSLGKFTKASIMAGTNWIMLQYENGDTYSTHCKGEPRRANILLTCDPSASDNSPGLVMLEEENGKQSGCFYLFELAHPEVCAISSTTSSSLSVGSIFLIVFFCVLGVYLIAGALYQRFVLGAKGMEQIPNYEFWKDFGNLEADGCDFVCRAHDSKRSTKPYKGLGDDQLEEREERDDNLLPM